MSQANSGLSPIKRALRAVEDMQAKLEAMEYARKEPIAIVGMGCRFPGGANTPEAFWDLLQQGEDAVVEVPADRWDAAAHYDADPQTPGKTYTREAGFLEGIDEFDAQFFGISAREAASLDPQHRLLLEVGWEALEHGNQASNALFNSTTGVFVGICSNDYNKMIWDRTGAVGIDAFCATGNALSVAAGRLSHALGLKGPSLAVDTACSSALVAVHLACQSLRAKECDLALAGGIHLMLSPESTIAFARTQMLDPSGRCKTFDAEASGYARGEGCGLVALKRLSDATRDRDAILAVIRGSAVNHNGRSSSLVAPNGPAQQEVIRQALTNGDVDPARVDYVEVQGTGTATGQPIEVGAIASVLCEERSSERPLTVGSVKTNLGHLEGASGVASLIKTVLALQHQQIPPHLHLQQPNPHIDWQNLSIRVATQAESWPAGSQPRLAGINCFGFSGTNAHIVLEEAPSTKRPGATVRERPLHVLALSAKTETALRELAGRYQSVLGRDGHLALADICFSANTGRSHFQHRLSAVGASEEDLRVQLGAFAAGERPADLAAGKVAAPPKVAFLLPDGGGVCEETIRELYETQPIFRAALEKCDAIVQARLSKSLLDSLALADRPEAAIGRAVLFAIEYSLYQLWRAWGIEPTSLLCGGIGTSVAACVAGVFDLEAALALAIDAAQLPATLQKPRFPIVAGTTGQPLGDKMLSPDYWQEWGRQLQAPATGSIAVETLAADAVLIVGPEPSRPSEIASERIAWLASFQGDGSAWPTLLASLSQLYVGGSAVNWQVFDRGYPRQSVRVPTYAWQHKRHWIDSVERPTQTAALDPSQLLAQIRAAETFSEAELQVVPKLLAWLDRHGFQPTPSTAATNGGTPADAALAGSATNGAATAEVSPTLTPKEISAADVRAWLMECIASELGVERADIDPDAPFDSYGLDSVLAIGIAAAGKQTFGVEVTPLMLVHHPTITALSRHIAAEFETAGTEVFEF